jgi:signal transduction histidine kinase
MTFDPTVDERRAQLYFEGLTHLLSCRTLDEVLNEALSLMVNALQAVGGSVLYVSTLTKCVRQGDLGAVVKQIEHSEGMLASRLRERVCQIQLPSSAPVTKRAFPDQGGVLLTVPLIGRDRIYGSISLFLPTDDEPSYQQEQALGKFACGVCAIANDVEQLTVTRQRLSQLGLFYQMGQAMTSTFDLNRLFGDTIELAISVIDAQAAILRLYDREREHLVFAFSRGGSVFTGARRIVPGRGIAGWVALHGMPTLVNDVALDGRFDPQIDGLEGCVVEAVLCVPLKIKGRVIGILEVLNKRLPFEFDQEDMNVLITLAAQTAIALDNARLYQSLRAERDRIIEAQETTRRELARNLHDGPVQLLAVMVMMLDHLEHMLERRPEVVADELDALRKLARQAMQDARLLLFELRPVILETQGLVPALQTYVERLGENARLTSHFDPGNFGEEALHPRVAGTVFSIVQEAVTNAQKHAEADNIWIQLERMGDELIVSVEDDGIGFDVRAVRASYDQGSSLGLLNMQDRAELIEAVLKIASGPERENPGTLIQLRLPLPDKPETEESKDGRTNDRPVGR